MIEYWCPDCYTQYYCLGRAMARWGAKQRAAELTPFDYFFVSLYVLAYQTYAHFLSV